MKKKEEKLEVRMKLPIYISFDNFEGDTEKIIQFLENIYHKLVEWVQSSEKAYPNAINALYNQHILSCHRYEIDHYFSSFDGDKEINLYGIRWETDEEFNLRLEKAKRDKLNAQKAAKTKKINQEKAELELFNKLKKKYDSKNIKYGN